MKKLLILVLAITLMLLISSKVFAEDKVFPFPPGQHADLRPEPNLSKVNSRGQIRTSVQSGVTFTGGLINGNAENAECGDCVIKENLSTPGDAFKGGTPTKPADADTGI